MTPLIGVVEHDEDCPPGLLGTWIEQAGARLEVHRPYRGDALPDPDRMQALLVLGGPMDAWDETVAWLGPTRRLVREAAERHLPTLGVCLGHQLCGLAFSAEVGRSPRGQQVGLTGIGWHSEAEADPLLGTIATRVPGARGVHWNDDLVLDLPHGATALAVTPAGDLQAARFADSVWGVQWHPEVDETLVAPWAAGDAARHAELGIDQTTVLHEISLARAELAGAWRMLAESLVTLARPEEVVPG